MYQAGNYCTTDAGIVVVGCVLAFVACDVEGLPGFADGNEGYGTYAVAGEFAAGRIGRCACAGGVERPVDVDFETFRCERGSHLFSPFHEDDGVVAGIFEFFVESEGFEFVE